MRRRPRRHVKRKLRRQRLQAKRGHNTRSRRDRDLYQRYDYRCVYCGHDGSRDLHSHMLLSIDHLIPKALGGSDDNENLVCACIPCNRLKGHFDARLSQEAATGLNRKQIRDAMIRRATTEIELRREQLRQEFDDEIAEWRQSARGHHDA